MAKKAAVKSNPKRRAQPDRLAKLERRVDRIEERSDKIADVLVPLVSAWKKLRARIPQWLSPAEDILPDKGDE